jgi:hypothetical protein
VPQPKQEIRPPAVQTQLPMPVVSPLKVVKESDPFIDQPTLTDFGLYKCDLCGKMVLGFDKANHKRDKHSGKSVEWRKLK